MPEFTLRKTMIFLEDIAHDGGPAPEVPRQRGAIVALVKNPFAGQYVEDLTSHMDALKPLGLMMTDRLIAAMGGIEGIDGYGKAAMCGEAGELEHTALWHVPGGYSMRERLGEALAIVPSAMKQGGPGTRIDVPLGHINAAYVRSHFDAMEVGLPDGPRADELMFALAMSRGGRVHARMGGLEVSQIAKMDGLR
ncbi:amino acid synthesis family protein [Pseudooceanicola nanhaiensis]|uniref:amino acid synthesis family protein n=1 Tax=Pseudooceanicola nanhaiensis TaxID=375761 RepID=UPI001CD212DE|nr:amino acid synthesis family protein [Pseudooceanicola nanhaiensis]MCA0922210.1 amino acid synthesis family protein [Pseudooceanicola nanhaiensis]